MVEKFKEILRKMNEKGNVSLLAVLKMDDLVDKWSVVLCADWAIKGDEKSFNDVVAIFSEVLSSEELYQVARIGIFSKDDYIAKLFFPYKAGFEIKEKTQINGFVVYEGYIIESKNKLNETLVTNKT